MVRKPFSNIDNPWPCPLTFWPQNQWGTSLTHGEQVFEVSLLYIKRYLTYSPETNCWRPPARPPHIRLRAEFCNSAKNEGPFAKRGGHRGKWRGRWTLILGPRPKLIAYVDRLYRGPIYIWSQISSILHSFLIIWQWPTPGLSLWFSWKIAKKFHEINCNLSASKLVAIDRYPWQSGRQFISSFLALPVTVS